MSGSVEVPVLVRQRIAEEALALCEVPFRLQGSEPATGLDCVGLVAVSLRRAGLRPSVPQGYGWRSGSWEQIRSALVRSGLKPVDQAEPGTQGDIVVVRPDPFHWHVMIQTSSGHVHAHAGLRKVVLHPGSAPWPVHGRFRAGVE